MTIKIKIATNNSNRSNQQQ